jgi:hypothetical protein
MTYTLLYLWVFFPYYHHRGEIMIGVFVLIVLLGVSSFLYADDRATEAGEMLSLETFEKDLPHAFPQQWQIRGNEDEARTIYQVTKEGGNHFLRAHTKSQGIQIGLPHSFEPKKFPALQWRWRAAQLPPGGDERTTKMNDSAAAVYVIFDSRLMPRAIKYVWSSTLPAGTRLDSPVYWRAKVVVLQSGPADNGEWRQETVNFYQDYKELFGFEPGEVQGIAVLTDSDKTKSIAEADYDDFTLLSAKSQVEEKKQDRTTRFFPTQDGLSK